MNPTIPIKNPRSVALVGLTMMDSDETFRAAWQKKFPDQGVRTNEPTSFGSRGATEKTSEPEITGDAKKKEENKRLFLDEVAKFQEAGNPYDEAWRLAGITQPGKSFYENWARGADKEKFANEASSFSDDADVRARQAKFRSLMNARLQEFPNENYEARFVAVASSEKGQQLCSEMARPSIPEAENRSDKAPPSASGAVFATKEDARAAFMAHVEDLLSKGLDRNASWSTAAASEPGRSAYHQWKLLAAAERPKVIRTPPTQPSEVEIQKKRAAMARENEK